jgi:hypothetical protein
MRADEQRMRRIVDTPRGFGTVTCRGLGVVAVIAVAGSVSPLSAQRTLTQQEALQIAFPAPATIERRTAFLSETEIAQAREIAGPGVDITERVLPYYVATAGDSVLGVGYFEAHRVRTLPEVLLIAISPGHRIQHIEVLRFSEPPEYRPPGGWLRQFTDRNLSDALSLKGAIVGITGATLTSRAVTEASRRILALHQVIQPLRAQSELRNR